MLRAGAAAAFPFGDKLSSGVGSGPSLGDGRDGRGTEVTLLTLLTLLTEGTDRTGGGACSVKTALMGRGRCGKVWVLCWNSE
jgi:hypothetical protein